LFFDIETVALPGVEEFLPEPRVAANIKDPTKVAAAREEKLAEALERAPLDADLASVKLIAMQVGLDGAPTIALVVGQSPSKTKARKLSALMPAGGALVVTPSEVEAIQLFWGKLIACGGACVGYNILGFDIPFIMRRSMALHIDPGITPNLARYRTEPVTDLMATLFNYSWGEGVKKLKWLAARYGLTVTAPDVDGSKVAGLTDAELIEYGLSDLGLVTQLYRRMNRVYFSHWMPGDE
jgi:hypothetical protein